MAEEGNVFGGVKKVDEAGAGGEETDGGFADGEAAGSDGGFGFGKIFAAEDLADGGHIEAQKHGEHGELLGGFEDLALRGDVDGGEQEGGAVAEVLDAVEVDALAPLDEDGEAGLVRGEEACGRGGAAIEGETGDGGGVFSEGWRVGGDAGGEIFAEGEDGGVCCGAFPGWRRHFVSHACLFLAYRR